MDNPYRSVSNIAYCLRRILSIIDLGNLIVGRHGIFVINPVYNVYTDFDRFEDNCRRMEAETNPKAQSELYQATIELYRGDLFSKISYQELICKGWFLPPNTYDCGSFVVNGTAVVGKKPKRLITAGNQHTKELIFMKSLFEQLIIRRAITLSQTLPCQMSQNIRSASMAICAAAI